MPKTTNFYDVTQIKQLIDLNQNKTNFNLDFEVKSVDGSPFQALVVSEANLNTGNELEYKNVTEGFITGNILNDKGVYQNYFLLLKAETPTKCEVTLDLKDVPLNAELRKFNEQQRHEKQRLDQQQKLDQQKKLEQQKQLEQQKKLEQQEKNETVLAQPSLPPVKDQTDWTLIGIVVAIGAAIALWVIFGTRKTAAAVNNVVQETPVIEIPKLEAPPLVALDDGLSNIVTVPITASPSVSLPEITAPVLPKTIDTGSLSLKNTALFDKLKNYFGDE